jgi:hypothetical protein
MSTENPNTAPYKKLRELIHAEEEKTNKHAKRVCISRPVAIELVGMKAKDWFAADGEWTDETTCEKIAGDFFQRGIAAAHGLIIKGVKLEVAESFSAPPVEIIEGTPY